MSFHQLTSELELMGFSKMCLNIAAMKKHYPWTNTSPKVLGEQEESEKSTNPEKDIKGREKPTL